VQVSGLPSYSSFFLCPVCSPLPVPHPVEGWYARCSATLRPLFLLPQESVFAPPIGLFTKHFSGFRLAPERAFGRSISEKIACLYNFLFHLAFFCILWSKTFIFFEEIFGGNFLIQRPVY
jgi:hypothetical protein